jgi:hypothetical protein
VGWGLGVHLPSPLGCFLLWEATALPCCCFRFLSCPVAVAALGPGRFDVVLAPAPLQLTHQVLVSYLSNSSVAPSASVDALPWVFQWSVDRTPPVVELLSVPSLKSKGGVLPTGVASFLLSARWGAPSPPPVKCVSQSLFTRTLYPSSYGCCACGHRRSFCRPTQRGRGPV